jgi:hypothetical protein
MLRLAKWRKPLEFAEREIILADGPRQGHRFRADFMPFSRLVLEEFDRSRYRRFFGMGPTQSGKTLLFYQIPALYHLFEIGENIILGGPTAELAYSIYLDRLLPSIRAGRYEDLLPRAGAGSRGGKTLAIRFRNGAVARFMGAGGGDQQRSSYTARVIIMSEMDKMDRPGKASREASPIAQMEARASAFGEYARIYGECTVSIERGSINQETMVYGTGSSVQFDCPACSKPTPLEREDFHGWQAAADLAAARANGHFVCRACGKPWSERDRQEALRRPRLVARSQSVDAEGQVVGEPPATNTFGVRWTAGASRFLSQADIAEREFKADSGDDEVKRGLMQWVWTRPFEGEAADFQRLEADQVLRKMVGHERKVAPKDTQKITLFIDVGSYACWWALVAWQADASGHVMDFGKIEVPNDRARGPNPLAVLGALQGFREHTIAPGWLFGRRPDLILVDSGYEHDMVYKFVQESGQGPYLASKGFGTSKQLRWHAPRVSSHDRQVGNEWTVSLQEGGIQLVEIHSDYWKGVVHDGFQAAVGSPGSITIFNWPKSDDALRKFAQQVTAERRHVERPPGKEAVIYWVVESRANHYLDCLVGCRAAADMLGIKLVPVGKPPAPPAAAAAAPDGGKREGWLRSRY